MNILNLEEFIELKHEPEILSFFLLSPPRAFFSDEVAFRLGIPRTKTEAVLNKMVLGGQMKSFVKKNIKYFLLKPDFKPFPELKQALLKEKIVYKDELYDIVEKMSGVKAGFLSGVFVGRLESPVDLFLVGKPGEEILNKVVSAAEKMMGQELNYCVMNDEEFWVRRNTFDRFVKEVFDYHHLTIMNNLKYK